MTQSKPSLLARILPPAGHRYLYFAVFAGGLTTLAAELSAERLLGPVFGTTNLVLAGIIGLILLYLTVGYYIGGAWSDRNPNPIVFYQIMAWAGFTIGLVPAIARPILRGAALAVAALNGPVAAGALGATLIVFVVPITLLGCLSPFAIRLVLTEIGSVGSTAGRIYAVSTLGSLIGTFLPALFLIPLFGTHYTYVALAVFLLVVALIGLFKIDRRRALIYSGLLPLLLLLGWLTGQASIKPNANTLYEGESTYNYIQVVEINGTRYLLLNEGQGIHSIYNPTNPITYGTWDYFNTAPFFNAPPFRAEQVRSTAIVGLAAGTSVKQFTEIFGPIPTDGFEIDAQIITVGQQFFAMDEPHLNIIIGDARWGLANSPNTYDLIAVDAYRLPYIPWQLTTVEFFQIAHDHLDPEIGTLVINVGRTPNDRRLIDAMANTLLQVFPSVHVMDVPDSFNSIMVATMQPTTAENLATNAALVNPSTQPLLADILTRALRDRQPTQPSDVLFTDDHAPLEYITNAIVLNYLLGDGLALVIPGQ